MKCEICGIDGVSLYLIIRGKPKMVCMYCIWENDLPFTIETVNRVVLELMEIKIK
jgi:hypothetical protein